MSDGTGKAGTEHRHSFFRQGGWVMIATTASGIFMFGVHFPGLAMGESEYGIFGGLLLAIMLMMVPALGLQTVFAQQASMAHTDEDRRQLSGTARALLKGTFILWVVMAAGVLFFQRELIQKWSITNPVALWVTILIGLLQLWMPITLGLLQGDQNFLWYGWAYILNGAVRFFAALVLVLLFHGKSTSAIIAALLGFLASLAIGVWQSRDILTGPATAFDWRRWLRRVIPLTLGLGIGQLMMSLDGLMVKSVFEKSQAGAYLTAGLMGRGLVLFTAPLTAVLFPKVARSFARGEGSNVMAQAIGATAALAGTVAAGCTVFAWLIPSIVDFVAASKTPFLMQLSAKLAERQATLTVLHELGPWFTWSMLPLALFNVLVSGLLARECYAVVPWLVGVVVVYLLALGIIPRVFLNIVWTMGAANLALFGVTAWFTWGIPANKFPVAGSVAEAATGSK
ncbi:MAG TPA: hypothetical protein VHH73_14535 [Verrucomicrobiae bacterium]|nr:hypothetical protein [Verrucomicrobiae bacterium]